MYAHVRPCAPSTPRVAPMYALGVHGRTWAYLGRTMYAHKFFRTPTKKWILPTAMYAHKFFCTPMYAHIFLCTPMYAHVRPGTPRYAHVRPGTPMYAHVCKIDQPSIILVGDY